MDQGSDAAVKEPVGSNAGQEFVADTARDEALAEELLSRVALIEDQPLEQRAEAYTQLFEELKSALEAGDLPRA
ncbi:hypothetical protein [Ruicaihuangia caeni]|uniref:Uncharacterized protein n=1 Tax=Ruicaihuangia caeni TaxID=3042517 RepID=A0AAW6T993_9MICO|nr:hypothetical protein [Klugiella sp. YN-L-19]MDI2098343.1 hypothetical protein [Klugiella sp. YN-L-19]